MTALAAVGMLAVATLAGGGHHRAAPAETLTEQPVRLTPPLQPAESAAASLPKLSVVRNDRAASQTRLTSV